MLTENEKNVLRLLMSSFVDYSINQIAKECNLAPNGALKILRKFEEEGILQVKDIANIKSYRVNFDNEKTAVVLELALIPVLEGRIKHRLDDFKEFKEITKCCILFGSYVQKKNANDLDVLFVLDNYKQYKRKLAVVKDLIPAKIHDVLQTQEDLKNNIIKQDKVILEILRNGVVLWGHKLIIEVVKDVKTKELF